MSNQNYYDILGVKPSATKEEIKDAYRDLSKMYHPDMNSATSSYTKEYMLERFKTISAAHSVLSNVNERRKYDSELSEFGSSHFHKGQGQPNHDFGQGHRRQRNPPNSTFYIRGLPIRPGLIFAGVCLGSLVIGFTKDDSQRGSFGDKKLVQAWKDPKTGEWHAPAPWDPVYRSLNPELQLIPRSNIKPR